MSSRISRRSLLGAGVAASATLALPSPASADAESSCVVDVPVLAKAPAGGRIDLHAHHVPPVWREALSQANVTQVSGAPIPAWSPERHLAMMDANAIQLALLSLPDPGVSFLSGAAASTLARQVNEYTAGLVREHPTRFGGLAVLPLPDIAASLRELAYALDVLKLDGVALLSSYGGVNTAMPQFELLWAELNRRRAFVFLHPQTVAEADRPSTPLPAGELEPLFDVTRFCALALNTALTTLYPSLQILLAHAGGGMPFLAYRIGVLQNGAGNSLPIKGADAINALLPAAQLEPLLFDTALSASPAQMASVLDVSTTGHVVLGTDWPFTARLLVRPGDPQPELSATFDEQERHAIERGNALGRLPRIAAALRAAPTDTSVMAKLRSAEVRRTGSGSREVRIAFATGEAVQVVATLRRGRTTVASERFPPVAAGQRSVRLALPTSARGTHALHVTVSDAFRNTTAWRRKIVV